MGRYEKIIFTGVMMSALAISQCPGYAYQDYPSGFSSKSEFHAFLDYEERQRREREEADRRMRESMEKLYSTPSYTTPSYTPPSFSSSGFGANTASGSGNVFVPAKTKELRADLGGFVRTIECCEDLEHFLSLLQSEGFWKTNRAGNVVHITQLKEPPKMVDGVEVVAEADFRYSIDLDHHTATLAAKKSETTVAFEFGRYRPLFKGKLGALAAKKFATFVWQLEERDIDAILDMLLSNKDVKHRTADGSERITSNVQVDGFKCVETVVLDRKNNTAEVTVSCAPLRLKAAVTQKDLKEAQKRAAENDTAVKVYETQRASERKTAELRQKANAGDLDAIKQLADQCRAANDETGALGWYRKAVDLGHAEVAGEVADRLLTGRGFTKDPQKALEWYRLSYEKGDKAIPLKLAEMYRKGEGFAKSEEKALEWYTTAYKAGDTSVAQKLAEMYLKGEGFAKSEENALKWYETAYKAGDKKIAQKLAEMYLKGEGFAKSEENALKWYETAYKAGDKSLAQKLAEMYLRGDGFAKNEDEALKWYDTAFKIGGSTVAKKVAENYLKGDGFAKSEDKALEWYRKAVEKGDRDCALIVARRLRQGGAFTANIGKALEWYSLAAEKGVADAARELAEMYRYGRDVTKDEDTALSWYRRLVENQAKEDERRPRQSQRANHWGWGFSPEPEPKRESAATARRIADDLLNGKDFTPSEEKAWEWYMIAHRCGDKSVVDFFASKADQYRSGDSRAKIKQDNAKALEWYQKWVDATEDTDQKIRNIKRVAEWLQNGNGFKKDGKAAIEWYKKAIVIGGDGTAAGLIADLYRYGSANLPNDDAKALEWYQKWVDATEDTDQKIRNIKRVAEWLQNGNGFKKDGKAAIEWYQKAADLGDKDAAKQIEKLRKRKQ